MKRRGWVPRRGDAVWLSLEPQAGHEQAGRRPALVVSPEDYNQRVGLALVCPITNRVKGYPWEVVIPGGVAVSGAVLSDQVKSLDWKARRAELLCELPAALVAETIGKLSALLAPEGAAG